VEGSVCRGKNILNIVIVNKRICLECFTSSGVCDPVVDRSMNIDKFDKKWYHITERFLWHL
jgi:hypothetical protein